ncbi:hypothetical protein ACP4OV_004592 [Aristida adscensionis]
MVHQTLIPSFPTPSPVSASSSSPFLHASDATAATTTAPASSSPSLRAPAMPSYAHHHSPMDGRTDALKSGSFPAEEMAEEAAALAMFERDGFSVEDLLDLEEFGEPDKDGADFEDAPPAAAAEEKSSGDSQPSSAVSYELVPALPPAPEMVDLPAHDVEEELEWVSRIMDDSLSELPPAPVAAPLAARPPPAQWRTAHEDAYRALLPPVVAPLATRPPLAQCRTAAHDGAHRARRPPAPGPPRAPTVCALSTEAPVPVKAKRSKRSRGSGWSLSGAPLFSDTALSSSSTATTSSCSSSGSFPPFLLMDSLSPLGGGAGVEGGYPHNLLLPPPPSTKRSKHGKGGKQKPKKRGRKPKHPPQLAWKLASPAPADRRCSHCGVQKTPQWRAGPEGAKTLCNACGVRYKSGRLLPEYRPACSPTFVSDLHSNSHRKVLEMRRKKEDGILAIAAAPAVASF